jgi:hypothetical protein
MTELRDALANNTIYVYKLTTDNGGAPCIHDNLLSLSICKPRIRMDAEQGDWIVGFGGSSKPDMRERLIYIARVTKVVSNGDYYAQEEYRHRPDCIYRRKGTGYEYVQGSRFHEPGDLEHDLGSRESNYERARNLLSSQFVYFGGNREPSIEKVMCIYRGLPRDFLKDHLADSRARLEEFIAEIVAQYGYGVHGRPTHGDCSAKCNQGEDDDIVMPGRCT